MAEKGYVFISYSSKDVKIVKELTRTFNDSKINYWKAPEMIPAGSNYAREIPQAINGCAVFLLVVSAASQNSIWVEKELDTAICARKKIIPVRIDTEELSDLYRFYLNNVQMIEADVWDDRIVNTSIIQQRISQILADERASDEVVQDKGKVTVKRTDKRSNALRINKIPLECEFCQGTVEQHSIGVYRCVECGRENYDDFQKIRNFLEKAGAAPIAVIARNTGVSYKTIEYFWNEEFLEIPESITVRLSCAKCGAPIRSGTLCDNCKINKEQSNSSYKGVWHTKQWKK